MTLRIRLLLSYLVLLAIALSVISGTVLLFIASRPAPTRPTYEKLATLARGLNFRDLVRDIESDRSRPIVTVSILELVDNFAESRNVRVLLVQVVSDEDPVVAYDSLRHFAEGNIINLQQDTEYTNRALQGLLPSNVEQFYGSFQDPETDTAWLVGGFVQQNRVGFGRSRPVIWLLAEEQTRISLQDALSDFSSAVLPPLIQAAGIGLLVAIGLAVILSRTIAKPLQAVASAAESLSQGDLRQRVPVAGPPEVKAVGEAFNQLTAEVLGTQQAQRDFLANVSHDLKTPLTSIPGLFTGDYGRCGERPQRCRPNHL